MSTAVMLSIRPEWCEVIISGKKTVEVRKTRPAIRAPFKCYIYCTSGSVHEGLIVNRFGAKLIACGNWRTAIPVGGVIGNGKVIAEFICDWIDEYQPCDFGVLSEYSCLTIPEICGYIGDKGRGPYGWHISDLVIYDKPRELNEFKNRGERLTRAPQSWCYVEELG